MADGHRFGGDLDQLADAGKGRRQLPAILPRQRGKLEVRNLLVSPKAAFRNGECHLPVYRTVLAAPQ